MRAVRAFQQRTQVAPPLLIWSYGLIFVFLIATWWIAKVQNIPMYELVADPAEIAYKPPYMGLLSQIGILIWSGALCICWFTASLLGKDKVRGNSVSWREFLWVSGGLSLLLLVDDWLQVHEYTAVFWGIARDPAGVPRALQNAFEFVAYILYAAIFAVYIWRYRSRIMQGNMVPVIVTVVFMGFSTSIDILPHAHLRSHDLLEEGSKLIGILSWFNYFFLVSQKLLRRQMCMPNA